MKTFRLLILAASILLAGRILGQAGAGSHDIRVPLEKAKSDPRMAKAIYDQVDPYFLTGEANEFVARITCREHTYIIYGSKEAWEIFFSMGPKSSQAWSKALL